MTQGVDDGQFNTEAIEAVARLEEREAITDWIRCMIPQEAWIADLIERERHYEDFPPTQED